MNQKLLKVFGWSNRFARRRARRQPVVTACYSTESLEIRALLAGNVLVALNGNDLGISGDNLSNEISITDDGTNLLISGQNGTRINGTFNSFSAPLITLRSIFVVTAGGNDIVTVNSFDMGAENFVFNLGTGNDDLQIQAAGYLSGNVDIAGGEGADVIEAGQVDVNGDFKIFAGTGSDRILLDGAVQVGLSMRILSQEDNDHVTLDGPTVGTHLTIDTAIGADAVFLRATVEGNIAVLLGDGPDGLVINGTTARRVDVTGGSGVDRLVNMGDNVVVASTFSSMDVKQNTSVTPLVFTASLSVPEATPTDLNVATAVSVTPLAGTLTPLFAEGVAGTLLSGVDPSVGTAVIDEFGVVTYTAGADDAGSQTSFVVEVTIFGSLVARLTVNVSVTA